MSSGRNVEDLANAGFDEREEPEEICPLCKEEVFPFCARPGCPGPEERARLAREAFERNAQSGEPK